jgi:formylmethanofuran dehydrogenase subunit E
MARVLLLLVIGFFIWLLFRGFFKAQVKDAPPPAQAAEGEPMVACAVCGVNMPRSEAREEGGRYTCRDRAACKHAG